MVVSPQILCAPRPRPSYEPVVVVVVSPQTLPDVPPTFLEGLQAPTAKPCKLQGFVRLCEVSPSPINGQTLQNHVNYKVLEG